MSPPHPAIDLTTGSTLPDLLPPPLDDAPEALRAGNHTAIAKVGRCCRSTGDTGSAMRLNAQYGSMVRTTLFVHGRHPSRRRRQMWTDD